MNRQFLPHRSDPLRLGAVLALAGGFMDAYSYLCREHVFANAQTGNIVQLGLCLAQGRWRGAARYLIPILAYVLGMVLAEWFRQQRRRTGRLDWRQVNVGLEALVLLGVSRLPQSWNLLANSLIGLTCGLQAVSFRTIRGCAMATTMCTGNLRSGTEGLCQFLRTGDREALSRSGLYGFVILCFLAGAALGNLGVHLFAEGAICIAAGLLAVAFILMFTAHDVARES